MPSSNLNEKVDLSPMKLAPLRRMPSTVSTISLNTLVDSSNYNEKAGDGEGQAGNQSSVDLNLRLRLGAYDPKVGSTAKKSWWKIWWVQNFLYDDTVGLS